MGMTDERIEAVLDLYERKLEFVGLIAANYSGPSFADKVAHAKVMIPKMREFLKEDRREKVFRWLGFLQGIFYTLNIYTIHEMAEHNKPPESQSDEHH